VESPTFRPFLLSSPRVASRVVLEESQTSRLSSQRLSPVVLQVVPERLLAHAQQRHQSSNLARLSNSHQRNRSKLSSPNSPRELTASQTSRPSLPSFRLQRVLLRDQSSQSARPSNNHQRNRFRQSSPNSPRDQMASQTSRPLLQSFLRELMASQTSRAPLQRQRLERVLRPLS
jgi:hypothetical protein